MKVAICIPTHADTKALFTLSLVDMVAWTLNQSIIYNGKPTRPKLKTSMYIGSSRVDVARERCAEGALRDDPDYLLWLDSDQTFPPDTLVRLMAHDLPFVGCACPERTAPGVSSVKNQGPGGVPVPVEPKPDGLEPVDFIGLAVCLIKAPVFRTIPQPWFVLGARGEDGDFCIKAKTAGIQPMLDHGLSMEIGHIGEVVHRFPRDAAA